MHQIIGLIPCYNVENFCEVVIEESLDYCNQLILVDDGSIDDTHSILEKWRKKHPQSIQVLHFEKNRGKGHALIEGMKLALKSPFDVLVTLDADRQHLPPEIDLLVKGIEKGSSFVIGSRNFKEMPFRSKFSNLIISCILSILYKHAPKDTQSGFRAFDREFAQLVTEHVGGGRYETEFQTILLALHNHIRIQSIPISTVYAPKQVSYFRKISDSIRILKVLFQSRKNL